MTEIQRNEVQHSHGVIKADINVVSRVKQWLILQRGCGFECRPGRKCGHTVQIYSAPICSKE